MKTKPIVVAGLAAIWISSVAYAQVPSSRMGLQVQVQSQQDRKEIKGSSADTVTQKKILQITVSGAVRESEARTGTWTVYGRDLKSREIVVLKSEEFKVALAANGQQKLETNAVETTSTPDHYVSSGGRRAKAKKVEATGTKYFGYSVILKDGSAIVASTFDPPSLKNVAATSSPNSKE